MFIRHLTIFISSLLVTASYADVILDGTIGRSGSVPGPNYPIDANLGQQVGNNLFHSFGTFNINTGETATFSGPSEIQNVISRVTGGNPSYIDGLIRSTIPHANLYLLNPYGILFGKNAKLDVTGDFHATTADTLRLGNAGQFNARQPSHSILTVAPVTAFGFLTDIPAPIKVQESTLAVTAGRMLSLIGGDLFINSDQFRYSFYQPPQPVPQLSAESGQINLASIAAAGDIYLPSLTNFTQNTAIPGGNIQFQNSWVNVGNGNIYIHGGRIELIDSVVSTNNDLTNNGLGSAGTINIEADYLGLHGRQWFSAIYANTWGGGQGGTVRILAKQLYLSGGTQITSITFGAGKGGMILIDTDDLTVSGKLIKKDLFTRLGYPVPFPSDAINGFPSGIFGHAFSSGKAGHIVINARQLTLNAGSEIGSGSFGSGDGGSIAITAVTVSISGRDAEQSEFFSSIYGNSHDTGRAGNIFVAAHQMTLTDESEISSSTEQAPGGNITVIATDLLHLHNSRITTSVHGSSGDGGNLTIENTALVILDNARLVAQADEGKGGNIRIMADQFIASPTSLVSASSQKGIAGNVVITSPMNNLANNLLVLSKEFKEILTFSDFCSRQLQGARRSRFVVVPYRNYSVSRDQ